ncbi:NFX1-type zinc finger-containing protein 1-like [Sitodiplosis mosellana]|uniref:NFX1-type zinc finger-containing protein 1-like n=1 Tax=Sitodiplosis mosellana TaxID=263140 RepID=UPI002443EFB5|nr:NFX1-type zinc finger-containing protein 1-like [Sitodiplosis mosellana]
MSNSDDDWFEKDIDEFVVQAPSSDVEHFVTSKISDADDSEYGGSYCSNEKNTNRTSTDQNKANNFMVKNCTNSSYIQPISFKKLSFLLDQTPLNIFLDIIQTDSGFFETLNRSSNSIEMMLSTIKVINRFIENPFTEHINTLLNKVRKISNYWNQIETILKETTIKPRPNSFSKQKKKNNKVVVHRNNTEVWQHALELSTSVAKYVGLPGGFIENILKIIDGNENNDLILSQFKIEYEMLLNDSKSDKDKDKECYQTYQQMDIYPSIDELTQKQNLLTYVKPNIIKGRFESVAQYLDIHLALLREDFISPLREGIVQIIEQLKDNQTVEEPKSNFNIRVYPNVRILVKQLKSSKTRFKSEYLMVDLEAKIRSEQNSSELVNTNKYSKKLMYGSLLCFSSTPMFENLIIAVVSNRDVDLLSQGYIQIEIIHSYNITNVFDRDLIMCESDVYFETYRHVYNVLKSFTDETFPMKNYIIDVDPTPHYPTYIPKQGEVVFTYKHHTLDLKNTSSWPKAIEMNFNATQAEALKHAITKQFSIIQGIPGSGKSHMGLEIVSTLLLNTNAQIVVISYTNHALDHFLSSILKYTDSIVRIGNQSKNEQLDRFNIKQLCENAVIDKRVKTALFKLKMAYSEAVQEFNELQNSSNTDIETFDLYTKIQAKLQSISRMQEEIKQIGEYQLIKSKRIVGMTSTGAARCNALVHLLQSPIVVFEEAAEMLESHIVAALTKNVQQLILIGDHQQLRPITSVYELARKFNMDISLFERMINNDMHCVTLTTQYRMRPEISSLIRTSIYKEVTDDDSVKQYPDVVGVSKNLYFIDHTNSESGDSDETTKKNVYESLFMLSLCNYLILQGYKADDITILTTYNGQVFQFAQVKKNNSS